MVGKKYIIPRLIQMLPAGNMKPFPHYNKDHFSPGTHYRIDGTLPFDIGEQEDKKDRNGCMGIEDNKYRK
jgi:hypothetical protein